MKTVFDKTTRDELIQRIYTINENSNAQWGKMNSYQMLKHCNLWDEWILGGKKQKQVFIGKLFGKMALKDVLKDETPLRRNSPTTPDFIIKGNGDVSAEKLKWITMIEKYEYFSHQDLLHPFFGKMTKEQIGQLAYKHADHHLRQFNS